MLSAKYRLTKTKDIQAVFEGKQKVFGKYMIINYISNKLPNPRFTFIVSSQTFKKATDRNYYKRILRHIVRELIPNIKTNYDFGIVIKKDIYNIKFDDIKNECIYLFNKIK